MKIIGDWVGGRKKKKKRSACFVFQVVAVAYRCRAQKLFAAQTYQLALPDGGGEGPNARTTEGNARSRKQAFIGFSPSKDKKFDDRVVFFFCDC